MENKSAVLVLGVRHGRVIGLDANLRWIEMAVASVNLFDVISMDSSGVMQKLRAAPRDILLSEKFQKLFAEPALGRTRLLCVSDMKIYKQGGEFKCDFSHNGVRHENYDMADTGFYIDGYDVADARVVCDEKCITAISPKTNAAHTVNLADDNVATATGTEFTARMREIETRMAEIANVADEYDNLKAELVAIIKENSGDLKYTYVGGFYKAVYSPPGIRRTIDSEKLKAAGLYESYIKESKTSPSVRIVKI